ncbi:MAG: ferrochelatase [Verrucomicrobia bacterium]|nr:ferrochelatase [Verrucomicrobiota bacterium]
MKGVLLANLGSPDSPTPRSVRRYLQRFLMDEAVLDIPWPLRFLLVRGLIAPLRAARSAAAYRRIWTPEGSPLTTISQRLAERLREAAGVPVETAMRYSRPGAAEALERLRRQGVSEVLVIPQFPQYAVPTWGTILKDIKRRLPPGMRMQIRPPFYRDADYMKSLLAAAAPWLGKKWDCWLLSFHGLPERHLRKADPTGAHCLRRPDCCETPSPAHAVCYRRQSLETAKAFARHAGVDRWSVAFQSRLGWGKWMTPYTEEELRRLAKEGARRIAVLCPAFTVDCLETLEEIGIRGRETFRKAGGEELALVPCLNDHPAWVETLRKWVEEFVEGNSKGGEGLSACPRRD